MEKLANGECSLDMKKGKSRTETRHEFLLSVFLFSILTVDCLVVVVVAIVMWFCPTFYDVGNRDWSQLDENLILFLEIEGEGSWSFCTHKPRSIPESSWL